MVLEDCWLSESLGPWAAPWNLLSLLPRWSLGSQTWNLLSLLPRWSLGSQRKSLPTGLHSGSPPLPLVAWGACHESILSLTLPLDQGESSQGRKQLEPGNVWKGRHPSTMKFLCLPSLVGIAPDSVHPMPSHYYSVHLRLSAHHPKLYLYQTSVLTHQGSLAKTE